MGLDAGIEITRGCKCQEKRSAPTASLKPRPRGPDQYKFICMCERIVARFGVCPSYEDIVRPIPLCINQSEASRYLVRPIQARYQI